MRPNLSSRIRPRRTRSLGLLALGLALVAPACLDAGELSADDAATHGDALAGDATHGDAFAVGVHSASLRAGARVAPEPASDGVASSAARDHGVVTVPIGAQARTAGGVRWLPEVVVRAVLAPPTRGVLARGTAAASAAATGAPDPREPVEDGWFALLHAGDLVLAQEAPPAWWGGPAAFIARGEDGTWALERGVREEALPHGLRAWLGREVRLYGVGGEVCLARVDGFALRSEFTDFGSWDDEPGATRDRAEQTPDEAWEDGGELLLGTLTTTHGDCAGAVVAVDARHAPRVVLAPAPVSATRRAAALDAFRALPAWRELQASFVADLASYHFPAELQGKPGRWDRFEGAEPVVTRFRDAATGRERVQVVGDADLGCGSPGGRLVAVFDVVGAGRAASLEPVAVARWAPSADGFIDVDGDGVLEALLSRNAVLGGSADDEPRAEVVIPDHSSLGCGC